MRKIRDFRNEILLVLLCSLLLVIWLINLPMKIERPLRVLCTVADGLGIIFVLRKLYREKWRKLIVQGMQKVFSAVAKGFLRWIESWNLSQKKNIITGETKIQFLKKEKDAVSKKGKKNLRWKHLQSEREKLRYLYRQIVSSRIKHGARIYASHTPKEIEHLTENTDVESKVFDSYILYRYDERKEPLEEDVLWMKQQMSSSVK